jgi:peptidoglycan/xylan/chitin deacetylase (PgdA/CDA1 family)
MLKNLLKIASPAGERGRLSILILHRVLPVADSLFPAEMDAQHFDEVCRWVKSWFTVLPLDEAANRLRSRTLPDRALAISFDDGYADNRVVAMPILNRHALTATFFIATGFLDGGRMWNDTLVESIRRSPSRSLDLRQLRGVSLGVYTLGTVGDRRTAIQAIIQRTMYLPPGERELIVNEIAERAGVELPIDLMMTSRQVQELRSAGMQIGAHTVSHPILSNLDPAAVRKEMTQSKVFLEDLLGERVSLFAYPSGKPGRDYTAADVNIAREVGFDAAFCTAWGAADCASDSFQLPRFTPWDRSPLRFGARMLNNLWSSRGGRFDRVRHEL